MALSKSQRSLGGPVKYYEKVIELFARRRLDTKKKRSHKYGIELPKTIKEALEIDKMTNTNFWQKALEKEIAMLWSHSSLPRMGRYPLATNS